MYLVCKADERLYNLAGFVEVHVLTNVLFFHPHCFSWFLSSVSHTSFPGTHSLKEPLTHCFLSSSVV